MPACRSKIMNKCDFRKVFSLAEGYLNDDLVMLTATLGGVLARVDGFASGGWANGDDGHSRREGE